MADFAKVPSRYACAHVFATPALTDDLARKLKVLENSKHFVKSFEIIHMDFWPFESQVFTLDNPFSLEVFYNDQCHDIVQRQVRHVASQLVGVCVLLREYPIIRFYRPNNPTHDAHILPYMIATEFSNQLDHYLRFHKQFELATDARGRSIFLILDRSVDPFAPLLHEFTFQAMAYDLLPIREGKKVTYEVDKPTGGKEKVEGIISEKDQDWTSLRHLHMQEVIEQLTTKMNRLRKENPHFADTTTNATVSDLQNMVAALPSFMETKDRFALNLHMASECMEILQRKGLSEIADIEQTSALGVTADARKPKTLAEDFVTLLADGRLGRAEKARLIIIYAVHRGGLIDADYKKLMKHANLDDSDMEVIRNMAVLGHTTIKTALPKKSTLPLPSVSTVTSTVTSLGSSSKKNLPKTYFSHSTEDVYSVSRFVPGVKNIVDEAIRGVLNYAEFPNVKDEPVEEPTAASEAAELKVHTSLRNPRQRAVWAKNASYQGFKQRIFVFVAGGITQSEARSIYELSKQYPKEVIIGGDDIITPNGFLRSLSRISLPRKQLGLPVDEPRLRVPNYLLGSDSENRRPSAATSAPASYQGEGGEEGRGGLGSFRRQASSSPSPSAAPPPKVKEKKSSKFGKFFK